MNNPTFIKGNIFNTKAQTIVNTVNCVGVMGKGIALVYKLRYPQMFELYQQHCKTKLISIGKLWIYKGTSQAPWVLNFPTKMHWKYPSKMEYITKGLEKFVETYQEKGITSAAFPLLGTHNGGLNTEEVKKVMQDYLSQCTIPIEIYDYDPDAPDDLFETFKSKWNNFDDVSRKNLSGLRSMAQVNAVSAALHDESVQSMIALINYKGVGIKTMEACFQMVMNHHNEPKLFE